MIEAVNGRLIGPKTWDRIMGNCWSRFGQSTDYLGGLCWNLFNNLCCGVHEAGNDHGFRVHKVELMLGLLKTVPVCMN